MDIKDIVKEKYGQAANRVKTGTGSACCGASACCDGGVDPITTNLYASGQTSELPEQAVLASLGCGNPTVLAELRAGETVLDLGSGGGIDVLLSARRVGPAGKAYGLDMTDEMLSLAEENKRKSGLQNVEFLKGEIENIPLPDESVDLIISNCVINLSADKDRVLREGLPASGHGSPMSSFAAQFQPRFGKTWSFGLAASPGRWKRPNMPASWPMRASTQSTSNRRGSTTSTMPGHSSPARAWTSTPLPRWLTGNS